MKWLVVFALVIPSFALGMPSDRQLPWMAGQTWWCSQDWNDCNPPGTHCGRKAWDFNWGSGSSDLNMPLLAPSTGIIEYAGNTEGGYGKVVLIRYPDGQYDRIAHCNATLAVRGEEVQQGTVVALCGGSGGWPIHVHINGQNNSNPADNGAFISCYFHYVYDGQSYWGKPEGCSCNYDDGQHQYTSKNDYVLRRAYTRNGGSQWIGNREYDMWDLTRARAANPNHPWYNAWNPNDLYRPDKTPKNCIIQHLNGGYWWDSAIVYDGLGGARRAYVLHSGFWVNWTNNGGPLSWIGMPVTDEYSQGSGRARQDFQRGYLYYNQGTNPQITFNSYPVCAPGMTASGWNPQVSYRIADIYASQANPRSYWGEASQFAYHSGSVWKQRFQTGRTIEVPDTYNQNFNGEPPAISLDLGQDGEETLTPSLHPVSLLVTPNPTTVGCTIHLDLPVPQTVELSVFDVSGRRVKLLAPSEFRFPGQHMLIWDGTDEQGRSAPMGIYYLRLVTPNEMIARPITVVR